MRHVNPIRQSGVLPSYYGTYTMEDVRKIYGNNYMGKDLHYCQMDIDELMRRVPGVTVLLLSLLARRQSISLKWDLILRNRSLMHI